MYTATGRLDSGTLLKQYSPLVRRLAHQMIAKLPANVEIDDLIQDLVQKIRRAPLADKMTRPNLFLHGLEDFQVERGDTLRNPVFTDPATGGLATFDVVIANPPFNDSDWGGQRYTSARLITSLTGLPDLRARWIAASMASGSCPSTRSARQPQALKRATWSTLSVIESGPSIEMPLSSHSTISLFSF